MNEIKNWDDFIGVETKRKYFEEIKSSLMSDHNSGKKIYPEPKNFFKAFEICPYEKVKVIILGQDPYHTPGTANGLAFSVNNNQKLPPSLKNIFKELKSDLGITEPSHGNLENWSRQGVLLLNSILTVEQGKPASHSKKGWERFTDEVVRKLNSRKQNIVYILWGKKAQEKCKFLDTQQNCVISSPHPSPFSARTGFFGSQPFSKTNQYLKKHKIKQIDWAV